MGAGSGIAAVLARHGVEVDPASGEDALLAELAARGWEVRVDEEAAAGGCAARYRALATRPPAAGGAGRDWHAHRQGSGRTAEAALGRILVAVLERGG